MLFAPVRLGSTALSAEVLTADVKNCKHFGPCGVGAVSYTHLTLPTTLTV